MSSSQELYNRLNKKLRELVPVKNGKQVTNWIGVVVGILQSQSSNLSRIANCLPMKTKAESRVTKIRRWLTNPQVKVWQFYKAILEHVLSGWLAVEAFIILDGVMVFGDRWLLDTFDKRLAGDYGVETDIETDIIVHMIDQAREFLEAAQEHLNKSKRPG